MSKSELVGRKVIGFEFVGGPGFSEKMKKNYWFQQNRQKIYSIK